MRKKLMAFVFVFPILLLIIVYSTLHIAIVKADIPVQKIKITNGKDGFLFIDLANQNDSYVKVSVFPENAANKNYSFSVKNFDTSSSESVIEVNSQTGKISANGLGKAIISVSSNDGNFSDSIIAVVGSSKCVDTDTMIVDAKNSNSKVAYTNADDEIELFADDEKYLYMKALPYNIESDQIEYSSDNEDVCTVDTHTGKLLQKAVGTANISIKIKNVLNGEITRHVKIKVKTAPSSIAPEYVLNVQNDYHKTVGDTIFQKADKFIKYYASDAYPDANAIYVWSADNQNVQFEQVGNGRNCKIKIGKDVETDITLKVLVNNVVKAQTTRAVKAVNAVSTLYFQESQTSFGILGFPTYGSQKIEDGEYVQDKQKLGLILGDKGDFTAFYNQDITLSDTENCLSFDKSNGINITATKNGVTTLTAKWNYADYFGEKVESSLKVKAVKDGVNVNNYLDLKKAADDVKPIVLFSDIMLGKKSMTAAELNACIGLLPTTYDWQYYKNIKEQRPNVYYALEFKADLHGNGFELNAENITTASDRVGAPLLYKGPLNFVAMSETKFGAAAVKGQDNISFLVRTDGVVIDNVQLKSCSDSYLTAYGSMNLSRLNRVGTTLEIMSDNVLVKNSRISNGRTVVRIFGGGDRGYTANGNPVMSDTLVDAETERINVKIESSILKNAREFIVKIGSNRAVKATGDTSSDFKVPTLKDISNVDYKAGENYFADNYFKQKYLIADVTLKNSILESSGLFSVGIDTHFAGQFLQGIASNGLELLKSWKDLAATSYACALRLEGTVKLLDWKNIDMLNSDTLIESGSSANAFLKLDIKSMIKKVVNSKPESYSNILENVDSVSYVHGGVAFFGGGLNYSFVDTSKLTNNHFGKYNINLSVLGENEPQFSVLGTQAALLPLAAGVEDFRFMLYTSNGESSYSQLKSQLLDGTAYSWFTAAV